MRNARTDKRKSISGFPHFLVIKGDAVTFGVFLKSLDEGSSFGVDVYSSGSHLHPEKHMGHWVFPVPPKVVEARLLLTLNFYGETREAVKVEWGDTALEPFETWFNPEFIISPVLDVLLLVYRRDEELEQVRIPCYVRDRSLLERYYAREAHQEAHSGGSDVFLDVFHHERVRMLTRLFRRYFEGAERLLDVGAGYSTFRCCGVARPFRVACCDLDEFAFPFIERDSPTSEVVVADIAPLPFENASFDGLFAVEVLERAMEPVEALREWKRVVRPGGILIITTTNASRLINRVNRSREVADPGHLRELTYRELWRLFDKEGLRVLYSRGIYLEFLFDLFKKGKKTDLLATRFNRPLFRYLIRTSMALGALARPLAYNLVFVLEKP